MDTEKVYSLEDLYKWDMMGYTCLAVIGDPIAHSKSPLMQNAALEEMAKSDERFKTWRYFKFAILEEDLGEAIKVFYKKRFWGLNVTIPHKVNVLQYCVSIDEIAKVIGASNTLVHAEKGYRAYNTDGEGLKASLKNQLHTELKDKDVIILGAGGAAKAAAVQSLLGDCRSLWIGNRNQERLGILLKSLGVMAEGKAHGFELGGALPDELPRNGILINATSLGLHMEDPVPIDLSSFSKDLVVMDMIYNPRETLLLKKAQEKGMVCTNGLRMLVEQGARSLQAWTKVDVPVEVMWLATSQSFLH